MGTDSVPTLRKKKISFSENKSSADWNSTNCAKVDKHGK